MLKMVNLEAIESLCFLSSKNGLTGLETHECFCAYLCAETLRNGIACACAKFPQSLGDGLVLYSGKCTLCYCNCISQLWTTYVHCTHVFLYFQGFLLSKFTYVAVSFSWCGREVCDLATKTTQSSSRCTQSVGKLCPNLLRRDIPLCSCM